MRAHKAKDLEQSQNQAQAPSRTPQKRREGNQKGPNPFMKFLQDSGDWIADKYSDVTEGIGETTQRVGEAANDLWDVATSTDVSFSDGGLDVETDLDEVMDLVPMDLGVILDREASDNMAQIHFAKDGAITIKSASIGLGAVNINGLQLSNAMLKGVHVHIRRERNGLIPKINPDESQITINIDSVLGQNISYSAESGPILAKEVELSNLHIVSTGKQAPFDDTPAGNMTFSVGSASVRGFNGAGASADTISAQNASGSISEDSGNIHAGIASASNMQYQGNHIQQAELAGLGGSFQKGSNGQMGANITAASAHASGIDTANVDVDSFSSSNLKASGNLQEQSLSGSLGSFSAEGIQNAHANAGLASGNGLSFSGDIDDKTGSLGAQNLAVQDLSSAHGSVSSANLNDVSVQGSQQGASGSIGSVQASGASSKFGSVQQADLNTMSFSSDGTNHSAQLGSGSLSGASSEFGSVQQAGVQGVALSSNGTNHAASISSASVTGASSEFGSVSSGSMTGAQLNSDGTNHSASLASAQASGIQSNGVSVNSGALQGAAFSSNGTNHSADIQSLEASGIQAADHGSIANLQAARVHANSSPEAQNASIQSLSAQGIQGKGVSIDEASAKGVNAGTSSAGSHASILDAHAKGTTIQQGNSNVSVDMATIHNAGVQQSADQTAFQLEKGSANGISVHGAASASTGKSSDSSSNGGSGIDTNALISSATQRIESGSIQAGAQLNAQDLGMVRIEDGTSVQADINIANNRVQDGSRISTSKGLDGPAWITADGAYVEKGKLMGDVNGFFDVNASKHVNKGMGLDGKKLHSIGTYGNAMSQQSSSGDSGSSSAGPGIIDTSTVHAQGNVQLSNGTIDAGIASADLAGTQSGDNQVSFSGQEGVLAVEFARFITSSLSINTDTVQMESDSASVSGGSLSIQADKKELDGTIGNVTIEGVDGAVRTPQS